MPTLCPAQAPSLATAITGMAIRFPHGMSSPESMLALCASGQELHSQARCVQGLLWYTAAGMCRGCTVQRLAQGSGLSQATANSATT